MTAPIPTGPRWPQQNIWLAIVGMLMLEAVLIHAIFVQLGVIP